MPEITFSVEALPAFLDGQQYRALAIDTHDIWSAAENHRAPRLHP